MKFPNYKTNLFLGYLYIFLFNATFWYGTWALFFLSKVSYGDLGIIQSATLFTTLITEVPTGALSDIIGKKTSLIISALLIAIGELFVPIFPGFWIFLITGVVIRLGMSFYSGTMDAFMYDTLVSAKQTDLHPKVLSRMSLFTSAAIAFASIVGGFLYLVNFALPWYFTFAAKLLCFFIAFFMIEPAVDTEKTEMKNVLKQNLLGFKHLFSPQLLQFSLFIVSFSIIGRIAYEILDDTNVVEVGLNASQIGAYYAIFIFLSLPISLLYNRIQKKIAPLNLLLITVVLYALIQVFTPIVSVPLYLAIFTVRIIIYPLYTNAMSQILNAKTPSNIRATTLSTVELISALPFVILSFPIGLLMESLTSRVVTGIFGMILLILVLVQIVYHKHWKKML